MHPFQRRTQLRPVRLFHLEGADPPHRHAHPATAPLASSASMFTSTAQAGHTDPSSGRVDVTASSSLASPQTATAATTIIAAAAVPSRAWSAGQGVPSRLRERESENIRKWSSFGVNTSRYVHKPPTRAEGVVHNAISVRAGHDDGASRPDTSHTAHGHDKTNDSAVAAWLHSGRADTTVTYTAATPPIHTDSVRCCTPPPPPHARACERRDSPPSPSSTNQTVSFTAAAMTSAAPRSLCQQLRELACKVNERVELQRCGGVKSDTEDKASAGHAAMSRGVWNGKFRRGVRGGRGSARQSHPARAPADEEEEDENMQKTMATKGGDVVGQGHAESASGAGKRRNNNDSVARTTNAPADAVSPAPRHRQQKDGGTKSNGNSEKTIQHTDTSAHSTTAHSRRSSSRHAAADALATSVTLGDLWGNATRESAESAVAHTETAHSTAPTPKDALCAKEPSAVAVDDAGENTAHPLTTTPPSATVRLSDLCAAEPNTPRTPRKTRRRQAEDEQDDAKNKNSKTKSQPKKGSRSSKGKSKRISEEDDGAAAGGQAGRRRKRARASDGADPHVAHRPFFSLLRPSGVPNTADSSGINGTCNELLNSDAIHMPYETVSDTGAEAALLRDIHAALADPERIQAPRLFAGLLLQSPGSVVSESSFGGGGGPCHQARSGGGGASSKGYGVDSVDPRRAHTAVRAVVLRWREKVYVLDNPADAGLTLLARVLRELAGVEVITFNAPTLLLVLLAHSNEGRVVTRCVSDVRVMGWMAHVMGSDGSVMEVGDFAALLYAVVPHVPHAALHAPHLFAEASRHARTRRSKSGGVPGYAKGAYDVGDANGKEKKGATHDTEECDRSSTETLYSRSTLQLVVHQVYYLAPLYSALYGQLGAKGLLPAFIRQEKRLSLLLAMMKYNGFAVDMREVEHFKAECVAHMHAIRERAARIVGHALPEFNIQSHEHCREAIYEVLGLGRHLLDQGGGTASALNITKGGKLSTAEETLRLLARWHEFPRLLLSYRKVAKVMQTYLEGMVSFAVPYTAEEQKMWEGEVTDADRHEWTAAHATSKDDTRTPIMASVRSATCSNSSDSEDNRVGTICPTETADTSAARYKRIHANFVHEGTDTGRLSCVEPNLQNIPRCPVSLDGSCGTADEAGAANPDDISIVHSSHACQTGHRDSGCNSSSYYHEDEQKYSNDDMDDSKGTTPSTSNPRLGSSSSSSRSNSSSGSRSTDGAANVTGTVTTARAAISDVVTATARSSDGVDGAAECVYVDFRRCLVAPPSGHTHCLLSMDYEQIELRVLAHLCEDAALIRAMTQSTDIHRAMAEVVFKKSPVSVEERNVSKRVVFGVLYGAGPRTLAAQTKLTMDEALQISSLLRSAFPRIAQYHERVLETGRQTGCVRTLSGRLRYLPDIRSPVILRRAYAERQAFNTVVQGSAADVMKMAMLHMESEVMQHYDARKLMLLTQIHDELVFAVHRSLVAEVMPRLRHAMTHAISLLVPLCVKVKVGGSLAAMQEWTVEHDLGLAPLSV